MRSGVDAEELAEDGVVVGAQAPAEVVDPSRGLGQPGHRGLHPSSGPRSGSSTVDEGAPGQQVLVGQQLLGVVDGGGGHLGGLEHRHGLVERAPADPRRRRARRPRVPGAWRETGST